MRLPAKAAAVLEPLFFDEDGLPPPLCLLGDGLCDDPLSLLPDGPPLFFFVGLLPGSEAEL